MLVKGILVQIILLRIPYSFEGQMREFPFRMNKMKDQTEEPLLLDVSQDEHLELCGRPSEEQRSILHPNETLSGCHPWAFCIFLWKDI